MNVNYNDQKYRIERRYFVGSNTLVAGQPLCYQENIASTTKGFGYDVEIPNADNEKRFCGIVAPESVGVTGPAHINVIIPRPGDWVELLVSNLATVAVGNAMELSYQIPTATASALGAMVMFAPNAANSVTLIGSLMAATLQHDFRKIRGVLLESVATGETTTGVGSRVLKWVEWL